MKLFRALAGARQDSQARSVLPLGLDDWASFFTFGGLEYGPQLFSQTYSSTPGETIEASFEGYVRAGYKSNGVVFACMLVRLLLFSEARFQFREIRNGRPGKLFGTPELAILETPWPNATTGDLLTRMLQDADLAGNFYGQRTLDAKKNPMLLRRRPDWMTIVMGSESGSHDDAQLLGYSYQPGGPGSGKDPIALLPEEVVHFAPIPDPIARYRGMSWLTPVLREIVADDLMVSHKQKFFENAATGNMVVTLGDVGGEGMTPEKFDAWVDRFEGGHEGVINAYRTIYLAAGADAKVVGADMKQMDFKVTQGAGETRIAAAAGVPPVIVGLSEGLQAATYSNYSQARRRLADGTMRPLWRNAAGSLATVVRRPAGSNELWYDDRDIPFLQEDQKDAAEIQQAQSSTIKTLVDAGFKPDSVTEAVLAGDFSRLEHTGLFSVQLQPAGTGQTPVPPADALPAPAPVS